MLKIFAYLDVTSMNSFRATSQAIAQIRFSNAFWKQRVHRDLPWLYGIELKAQRKTTLDWKGVHKMLRVIADPDDQRTNHRLPNRERVWGTCEQIANVYWAKLSERTAREAKTKLSSAGTLVSGYMPACADVSTRRTYREHPFELQAITDWMDIGAYSLHIATRWNDNGHLASLRTELHRGDMAPWNQDSAVDPSLQQEGNQQMLVVPRGKWVASITTIIGISGGCRATVGLIFELRPEGKVVVGNTNGDKRVLEVAEGNVFVGLRGEALDDLVVRLGVLEGKPPDSARNVSPFLAEEGAQNIALQRYVWAREIFPPQVMPRRPSFSSLVEDAEKSDLVTMDALLLGTTEEELEALTGISGDALLWGFAAHYSDRPSRKAGQHCHAMKHFAVSGAQGERVVAMDTSGHQLLGSISLKTNWSRQCVFGIAPRGRNSGPEQVPAADHFFAGFFGSWSYLPRGGKPNEMSSCSMLSCPTEREPRSVRQAGKTWALDGEGRFWDGNGPSLFDTRYPFAYYTEECGSPNEDSDSEAAEIEAARAVYHARWRKNQAEEDPRLPIAMEWRPSGPIYGNNPDNVQADTGVNHWMPTNAKIASVLDCSKAISKVEVWYTHPQRVAVPQYQRRDNPDMIVPQCAEVQFVSVILRLSDGSTTAFGPTEFDEMYKHHEGHEPLCDCWVSYEGEPESRRQPEKKLPFKLHYHSEEWTVGGQTLAQLWVWSSVFCDGLQFVAANGEESPLFGICDGEPSGVIEFGEGKAVSVWTKAASNEYT